MNDNYEQTDYSLEVEGQTQLRCCDVEKSFHRIIRRFDSHHNAFTLILIINQGTEGRLFLKLLESSGRQMLVPPTQLCQ